MSQNLKAALYCRVSTTDQNCDLQRSELMRYCEAREWKLFEVYEEKLSGVTDRRPKLQQMMRDARERKFDIVLVWKLDRFARSIRSLVTNIQELSDLGVQFVSLKDQLDLTTSAGRLMAHILGSFAEFEASLIKERVIAGLREAKRKGIRLGRPPRLDPQLIYKMKCNGESVSAIARKLKCSRAAIRNVLARHSNLSARSVSARTSDHTG